MKIIDSLLLTFILLIGYSLNAQEWSSRITIIEEHLIELPNSKEETNSSEEKGFEMNFLQVDGNAFIVNKENFSAGINVMFEDVLENGFSVKDMLVYSIGMSYDIGRFGLSFSFENLLNADQLESEILPIPEFSNGITNTVGYEIDSPFSVAIGVVFNF